MGAFTVERKTSTPLVHMALTSGTGYNIMANYLEVCVPHVLTWHTGFC